MNEFFPKCSGENLNSFFHDIFLEFSFFKSLSLLLYSFGLLDSGDCAQDCLTSNSNFICQLRFLYDSNNEFKFNSF